MKKGPFIRLDAGVCAFRPVLPILIVGLFFLPAAIPAFAEDGLSREDIKFLRLAIDLAGRAVKTGNHSFGAMVVKDGRVAAQGMNAVITEKDAFFHAETEALNTAYQALGRKGLEGATLYTSCGLCPMCAGAAYIVGVSEWSTPYPAKVWAGSSATTHFVFQPDECFNWAGDKPLSRGRFWKTSPPARFMIF